MRELSLIFLAVLIFTLCTTGPSERDTEAIAAEMYVDSLERAYVNHIKIDSFRLQTIRKYAPIALECNANH